MELIEAVHEKGASFRFQAKGYSMTPAIRDGDVITVSPLEGHHAPPWRRGGFPPSRTAADAGPPRAARERKKYYIKGDNCPESDGWVPAENILGLITNVEHRGKARFWPNRPLLQFFIRVPGLLSALAAGAANDGDDVAPDQRIVLRRKLS